MHAGIPHGRDARPRRYSVHGRPLCQLTLDNKQPSCKARTRGHVHQLRHDRHPSGIEVRDVEKPEELISWLL